MNTPRVEPKNRPMQPVGMPMDHVGTSASRDRNGQAQHRPPMQDADAARAVVISILRRIEGYVDEETLALDKVPNYDLKASNDRKSQGLVDLNQAMRRLKSSDVNDELEGKLQAFRAKLAVNLRKIRLHLEAVKEITAMLSDAIQSVDSDGTYTRQIGPYRSAV